MQLSLDRAPPFDLRFLLFQSFHHLILVFLVGFLQGIEPVGGLSNTPL
jgi:hypothetical protein